MTHITSCYRILTISLNFRGFWQRINKKIKMYSLFLGTIDGFHFKNLLAAMAPKFLGTEKGTYFSNNEQFICNSHLRILPS
jgi:hypothetical protein